MNRGLLLFALLLLPLGLPTSARADAEFPEIRDSFRNSFGASGTVADRQAAVEALSTFRTKEATKLLLTAIPMEEVRVAALVEKREAIRTGRDRSLHGRSPEPYLMKVKEELDRELGVLETVEDGLAKVTDPDAILYLAKDALGRNKSAKVRETVARVLARIGDRSCLDHLVKALGDRDAHVRVAVLLSLGRFRAEEALPQVVKALQDEDWTVCSAAIEALGRIRNVRAFESLLAKMEDAKGRIAEDCADALEKITGQRFGRSVAGWRKWWTDHRERALAGERFDLPEEKAKPKSDDGYYHGIPVRSDRTIFILDVSESMSYSTTEFQEKPKPGEPSRLDLAKRELHRVIREFDPKGQFGLIAFHSVVMVWRPRLVPASAPMKDDAKEWVTALEPTGTTNIYAALETAFEMSGMGARDRHYEPAADTIFLLSDGAPTNEDLTDDKPERIFRAVRSWNSLGRIRIHTIGMKGHSAAFMSRLARENGGTYSARD